MHVLVGLLKVCQPRIRNQTAFTAVDDGCARKLPFAPLDQLGALSLSLTHTREQNRYARLNYIFG